MYWRRGRKGTKFESTMISISKKIHGLYSTCTKRTRPSAVDNRLGPYFFDQTPQLQFRGGSEIQSMAYLSFVCDSRERNDDEKRSIVPFLLHEVGDEGNGLNGLTKTHLVCQDPVEMVVVQ